MSEFDNNYDIAIIGGGCVGGTLACALAQSGMRVAVIEAREAPQDWDRDSVDLRVFAITRASERIFRSIHVWEAIEQGGLSPFRDMRVWDAGGRGEIHFDSAELGEPTLGYIIEQRVIQAALNGRMEALPSLDRRCPAQLVGCDSEADHASITLADKQRLTARLIVGADGAESPLRGMAGIPIQVHAYDQEAVVAVVATDQSHQQTAWQRFLPRGPLAFLPLRDGRSSIVWSTTPGHAAELCALEREAFMNELSAAFGHRLGAVIGVAERVRFPLQRLHATRYIAERVALIGDAAHVIHPLAGQGVNLGLLDAACLAEVLLDTQRSGRDPGRQSNLRRYERWRHGNNQAMQYAMDGFKGLFGAANAPVRTVRTLGLGLVDRLGPVKQLIARHAMGLDGDLPRMAKG